MTIPAATLRILLGEGSIHSPSFRRNKIERFWPCGCRADYSVDRSDIVTWTPCNAHAPAVSQPE